MLSGWATCNGENYKLHTYIHTYINTYTYQQYTHTHTHIDTHTFIHRHPHIYTYMSYPSHLRYLYDYAFPHSVKEEQYNLPGSSNQLACFLNRQNVRISEFLLVTVVISLCSNYRQLRVSNTGS